MRSPYRWIALSVGFLVLSASPAQLFVRKGFNDPATLVDQMMSDMPHSLNLTSGQRKQMRRIYIDLSGREQRIAFAPGSSFIKRMQVRRLDDQAERKLQAVLSNRQYAGLQQWMHEMHKPKRVQRHRPAGR